MYQTLLPDTSIGTHRVHVMQVEISQWVYMTDQRDFSEGFVMFILKRILGQGAYTWGFVKVILRFIRPWPRKKKMVVGLLPSSLRRILSDSADA